ncbi:MAG TPA: IS1380 family transposase [Solirubrobacteraceae bacterium]|nr:IS1380 family transposase [Solirubrobacteraceae bacterium]
MKRGGRDVKVEVRADGEGLVSHAGAALLAECADRVGLTSALDRALGGLFERSPTHSPGRVIRDLAVMLADGGDALCDLGTVRDQEALFGPVASDATAYRLIERIAADPDALEAMRGARGEARSRAWRRGARPRMVEIDLDATLLVAHSDKDGAAGNYKGGFGFHPMLAYLDGSEEALAGLLRPGNAGANTAADQIAVLDAALAQLPKRVAAREQILMRADSAGATHELLDFCRDGRLRFSVGFDLTEPIRAAILQLGEDAWVPALCQDGEPRDDGAWVAEITDGLDLSSWPAGSRVIVRREIPHPGAQLSFTDHDGHRFQAILTDQPDTDIAYLEARHRGHARVEDRIKAGKDTGMDKLPFRDYQMNAVWLELSLIAQDLIAWTQNLCLDGELARSEPKRLRYRLLHVAGRLAFHARQAILHLDRDWPWANELAVAFARLAALPPPTR